LANVLKNHSNFKNSGVGFSEVCGQECGVKYGGTKNGDPEISIKAAIIRKQTIRERYNVDHISQLDSIKKQKNKTRPEETLLRFLKKDWNVIVGDSIAQRCYPADFKNQLLSISSDPGSVQKELGSLKPAIMFKIRERYKTKIKNINC
jgi:predicted nucleic acid-binding Zn ribbon protein